MDMSEDDKMVNDVSTFQELAMKSDNDARIKVEQWENDHHVYNHVVMDDGQ